jgi:hypothetical protein
MSAFEVQRLAEITRETLKLPGVLVRGKVELGDGRIQWASEGIAL